MGFLAPPRFYGVGNRGAQALDHVELSWTLEVMELLLHGV